MLLDDLDDPVGAGVDQNRAAVHDRIAIIPGAIFRRQFPLRSPHAVHGRSWFMDAMEARASDDAAWFRLNHPIIDGAGPFAGVLGPADWTHGIARPFQNVVADPNPQPDGSVVQAAGRSMGGRSRANQVATGRRDRNRERRAARHPWRNRPGLDVGDPGAVSEGRTRLTDRTRSGLTVASAF